MARGPPRAGASRSRSERAHARRNNRGDRWDRWEPFGSNRGGKGAPRGEPPPLWAGPDGAGPWRHDLFETEVQADRTSARPDVARWAAEPWLPPRGLGSGRSAGRRASGGGRAVAVWNLDISVTERDLQASSRGSGASLGPGLTAASMATAVGVSNLNVRRKLHKPYGGTIDIHGKGAGLSMSPCSTPQSNEMDLKMSISLHDHSRDRLQGAGHRFQLLRYQFADFHVNCTSFQVAQHHPQRAGQHSDHQKK
eukprot:CAMPEP_0179112474 /NCGR_PEP_ID=MMETSP0796-20121207/52577_1 /TAXON_ID=73915 /ORGANISM="Pyrodinium bahamense, Strain pbaha01" /LENGTH=251 /DNA_ID=CAMNT_0020810643 /DNA_START=54 /DNA_END=807 /DNA_ORIENTATION=+